MSICKLSNFSFSDPPNEVVVPFLSQQKFRLQLVNFDLSTGLADQCSVSAYAFVDQFSFLTSWSGTQIGVDSSSTKLSVKKVNLLTFPLMGGVQSLSDLLDSLHLGVEVRLYSVLTLEHGLLSHHLEAA